MAHIDDSEKLSGAAWALRLALVILPIIAVFLSVARIVQDVELLQTRYPYSLTFLVLNDVLYPLSYLAFGLWAAHVIKPIKLLNLRLLKLALISLAIALPMVSLIFDYETTGQLLLGFTKGGYLFFSSFAVWVANAICFAVICIFAATKIPNYKINTPGTVSGAMSVLRRALIIAPILSLMLWAIWTLLFRIDAVRRDYTSSAFVEIETLITPLAYLAIGVWAANLIKPIKRLDLQPLKWVVILLGAALPVVSALNDITLVDNHISAGSDEGAEFIRLTPDNLLLFATYWIRTLIFASICFFVAYKIESPKVEVKTS